MTQYQITLDSPMGERLGALTLREDPQEDISGTLSLLGFDNPVQGRREGTTLRLHHGIRTQISQLECVTELHPAEDGLCGTARTGNISMELHCQEMGEQEGKEDGTHGAER